MKKTLLFSIVIAWVLSILTVMAGEFSILATSIFLNTCAVILLTFILLKNGSNN
tara:strand:- start:1309 stop:1470 length:162 start_codon:yes stop_codon:yes gene_type:complete